MFAFYAKKGLSAVAMAIYSITHADVLKQIRFLPIRTKEFSFGSLGTIARTYS